MSSRDSDDSRGASKDDSREARVHAAIADACLGRYDDDALLTRVRDVLAARNVEPEDARAILEKKPRFWLYRELVWNNAIGVVRSLAPRACAMLDARAEGVLAETLSAFLRERGVTSHHFRDVPFEFFAWARPRLEQDARVIATRGLALDLFVWELFSFQVSIAPRTKRPAVLHDVAGDRALVFESPAILAEFGCRIHEYDDGAADPPRTPVILLGHRDSGNETKLLELNPIAATIVRELQAKKPLQEAIPDACKSHRVDVTPAILADVAKLLADLAQSEIVIGAA